MQSDETRGASWYRPWLHHVSLVPPLVVAAYVLLSSDFIWVDRNTSGRYASSTILAAHQLIGLVVTCSLLYTSASLVRLLPWSGLSRQPTDLELGCGVWIVRALALLALYGGVYGFLARY